MKNWKFVALILSLMLVLAACGTKGETKKDEKATGKTESPKELTIKHKLGEEKVPVNPKTVVVFDYGFLDTLDELGVEVAGVPQKHMPKYLKKYKDAKYKNIGGVKEPDFEAIHAMKPDVIFISGRQADLYDQLKEIAPTVFVGVNTEDYMKSFKENTELAGKIFGKEKEVEKALTEIDKQVADLQGKTKTLDKKALIILGTQGKVSAYGPKSRFGFIHDVYGFKTADEGIEASTHGQNITFEYILEKNPDIIFAVDRDAAITEGGSAKDAIENELVKKTNAYKNGKLVYLNPEYWYLSGGGIQSVTEMIKEVEQAL